MHLCTHHGTGNTLIIALGGYRQDMRAFEPLIEKTQEEFQWLLVHLPYISPESDSVTVYKPDELLHIIFTQLQQYQFKNLYLLGFSIGGRIAQHLFLRAPEKFDKLILINADGLKTHFLQWITQRKWISEKFLFWCIDHKIWYSLIKTFQKTGFIPYRKAMFYMKHIQNTRRRKILIQIWKKYASFKPHVKQLAKYKHKILLIWGKHDEVLPVKIAQKISTKHGFILEIIDGNHNMIEENYEHIAKKVKSI